METGAGLALAQETGLGLLSRRDGVWELSMCQDHWGSQQGGRNLTVGSQAGIGWQPAPVKEERAS